jgi:hypothetical protein
MLSPPSPLLHCPLLFPPLHASSPSLPTRRPPPLAPFHPPSARLDTGQDVDSGGPCGHVECMDLGAHEVRLRRRQSWVVRDGRLRRRTRVRLRDPEDAGRVHVGQPRTTLMSPSLTASTCPCHSGAAARGPSVPPTSTRVPSC